MKDSQIVLASASPRRVQLLTQIGITFSQCISNVDESVIPSEKPCEYVQRLALAKAQAALPSKKPVLGADTVVVIDDEVIGKPRDSQTALTYLTQLSGRTHQVFSGIAVVDNERASVIFATADVQFRSIDEHEARAYIASGEPSDKAGAYGIQGIGSVFVEEIRGQPSTVAGLPLMETELLLKSFKVDTWVNR